MSDRYFYLGPDVAMCRLQDGEFIFLDPQDETISAHLIARGYWERWIYETVLKLIKPGQTVIEVGANVGYYTLGMAKVLGESGRLISFEANPRLAGLTYRSIFFAGFHDRVEVISSAAGDRQGQIEFLLSRRNSGGGHISLGHQPTDEGELVTVPIQTLDGLNVPHVDFIRMDAEGSEPQILRGATTLLSNPSITICMEWDVLQMGSRTSVPEFVRWLSDQGFMFWKIEVDSTISRISTEVLENLPHSEVIMSRVQPDLGG